MANIINRKFVCYFHFVGFSNLSLGVSISLTSPNIELHVPFGFFRVGWAGKLVGSVPYQFRTWGIGKKLISG